MNDSNANYKLLQQDEHAPTDSEAPPHPSVFLSEPVQIQSQAPPPYLQDIPVGIPVRESDIGRCLRKITSITRECNFDDLQI